ncbi:MAG: hypothetical protein IKU10_01515 [Clostridia bacterium]|nr:hypothetical protein [Clostridia bacterium]
MDVVPYSTDYLHPDNAIDTVYAFFYQKGAVAPITLMMRKCGVGPIYRYYSLSQFDFDLIEQAQPDGLHVSINGVEIKPSF